MLREAAAAKERFVGLTSVLRFMRWGLGDSAQREVDSVSNFPTDFDRQEQHPLLVKWENCAAALATNADAALPT
jgi:hypothetical protein